MFDGQGISDVSQSSPSTVSLSPVSVAKVPQLRSNDRERFLELFEKSAPEEELAKLIKVLKEVLVDKDHMTQKEVFVRPIMCGITS